MQPLGDPKPKFVDVRVVAATNATSISGQRRTFREDPFRPAQRDPHQYPTAARAREEIPAMVEHFLEKFGASTEADATHRRRDAGILRPVRWPKRAAAGKRLRRMSDGGAGIVLMPAHLSDEIASSSAPDRPRRRTEQSTEVVTRIDQPLSAAVEHIERAAIQRAIKLADGRLDDAAKMLGLSRKGLYLKRQRLNLE